MHRAGCPAQAVPQRIFFDLLLERLQPRIGGRIETAETAWYAVIKFVTLVVGPRRVIGSENSLLHCQPGAAIIAWGKACL